MKVPHKALISVEIELLERLNDGKVKPTSFKKHRTVFHIDGTSEEECREKVTEAMTFFGQSCLLLSQNTNTNQSEES
tara:strand:+ start:335 stop:565 length:231 start_codon:yes stop_codon:yes gene_type:complete